MDVYKKNSVDLLLNSPTPASSGTSTIYKNVGEISNQGLEVALGSTILDKQLKWSTNLMMTFPKNETIKLA